MPSSTAATPARRWRGGTTWSVSCTVNEVLREARRGSPQTRLERLAGTPLIVPETLPLERLLTDMQAQRASLAVVADEYGRTVGIVTVEDIIEEIVGEIADETDPA
jgi:CBS domain containing-hemolysin-like protein